MIRMLQPVILYSFLLLLCSCTVGGAAMTGMQAVYNRHNLKKNFNDGFTTVKAYQAIYVDNKRYHDSHISISTYNDAVLITGQTPSRLKKYEIKQIVKHLAGKRSVYDFIEIANPSSVLTRASDGWITSKIKAQFIASSELDPSQIKVITENGTVFLLGTLQHEQANAAVDIAKNTSGVQSVVKVFSYLTISRT